MIQQLIERVIVMKQNLTQFICILYNYIHTSIYTIKYITHDSIQSLYILNKYFMLTCRLN